MADEQEPDGWVILAWSDDPSPIIWLSAEEMERLMEMLENPEPPSPALKALFHKHRRARLESNQGPGD